MALYLSLYKCLTQCSINTTLAFVLVKVITPVVIIFSQSLTGVEPLSNPEF